jgi:localization factor PodJL
VPQAAVPQAPEPAPAFPADEPPADAPHEAHAFVAPQETHGFGPPQFAEPSFSAANEAPPFAEEPGFAEPHGGFADLGLAPGGDLPNAFDEPFSHPDLVAHGSESEGATPESFLSVARRSARAAAERAEAEKRGRLGGFSWGTPANDGEEKPRSRYLALGIFGAVLVVVLAAGMVLSQRLRPQPADVAKTFPTAKLPAPTVPTLTIAKPSLPVALPSSPAAPEPSRLSPGKRVTLAKANPPIPAVKPSKAMTLDRVGQLANAGNATAETIMGLRYLDGAGGTPVNPAEAAKWLGQAANKGQAVAQYRYGTLLERGQGVAADPVRAAHLYLAAANQGNRKAMHNLAVSFAEGVGGRKDMAEAARWFSKAAGLGLSDSQFNLAVLYERGDGVPQSLLDAYKWYAIAAAQGDAESRQRLSVLQTQLGDADRAAAQRAAANFHAVALNRAANIPPETGDLGN